MYGSTHRVVRRVPPKNRRFWTIRKLILLGVVIYLTIILHPSLPFIGKADAGPKVTKPQSICLDPGHGGDDTGASNGRLSERNLNLIVALKVREILQNDGYRVFVTRESNKTYLYNRGRYSFCNDRHATILVSIHQNYFDDPSVDYTEALYFKESDQKLAQTLSNTVSAKLGLTNDNISQFEDGVLSKSVMPATVVEGLFVTSEQEYGLITGANSNRLTVEAQGIAQGIESYFVAPASPKPQGADIRPDD